MDFTFYQSPLGHECHHVCSVELWVLGMISYMIFFIIQYSLIICAYTHIFPLFFSWSAPWAMLDLRILQARYVFQQMCVAVYWRPSRPVGHWHCEVFIKVFFHRCGHLSYWIIPEICQHLHSKKNTDISTLWMRKMALTMKGWWGYSLNVPQDARLHEKSPNDNRCALCCLPVCLALTIDECSLPVTTSILVMRTIIMCHVN